MASVPLHALRQEIRREPRRGCQPRLRELLLSGRDLQQGALGGLALEHQGDRLVGGILERQEHEIGARLTQALDLRDALRGDRDPAA
jgi:hypothetical protein